MLRRLTRKLRRFRRHFSPAEQHRLSFLQAPVPFPPHTLAWHTLKARAHLRVDTKSLHIFAFLFSSPANESRVEEA